MLKKGKGSWVFSITTSFFFTLRQNLGQYDILFLILLVLVSLISIAWHTGIQLGDASAYVFEAKKYVATHVINTAILFSVRVAAWFPYAVYISLFGVRESITWVTTVELIILIGCVYLTLRRYDQVIALYASIFLGFSPLMMFYGTITTGDMMLTLLVNLPVLMYWRTAKTELATKEAWWGIIAGFVWIAAFFAKESAIYYVVLYGWLAGIAYYQNSEKAKKFWGGFWKTAIICGTVGLGYLYFQGGLFQKLEMMNNAIKFYGTDFSDKEWKMASEISWKDWAYRYTIQPLVFCMSDYSVGALGLMTIVYLVNLKKGEERFWIWFLIIPLIAWWVFPQRLNPYYPMRLNYRLWLPLMVPLSITAAHGVRLIILQKENIIAHVVIIVGGIFLGGCLKIFLGDNLMSKQELVFCWVALGLLVGALFIQENEIFPYPRRMALVILILPFFFIHWNRFFRPLQKTPYQEVGEIIKIIEEESRQDSSKVAVFAESYFVGCTYIHENENAVFYPYEDAEGKVATQGEAYLVLNREVITSRYGSLMDREKRSGNVSEFQSFLETRPADFRFTLNKEEGKYQIYHRKE